MHYYGNMMYYSPFSFIGPVLNILFWILIIAIVVKLIRKSRGDHRWHCMWGMSDAVETLRERYAKGEINTEEYEEKMKVLTRR